ncbi:hypothetical protein BDA99DRAFT_558073 [Phascolomyces articulosus]|uniref:Uncharacterized protein n=1 Tax=Phascolomyces articulosus TaxID=60185 RepID=A0AAD5PGN9_9FUNG|nr:hypothetical protein BDA99DRAFT_558073 [Phascolomyces articulosus]
MSLPSSKKNKSNQNLNNEQEPPDESGNSSIQPKTSTPSDVAITVSSIGMNSMTGTAGGTSTSVPIYPPLPAVRPRPRKRPPPPRRHHGTESSSSGVSWRWSTWSSLKQQRRRSSATLSMIFQQRRRTFPPASRVLQKEKRRFTSGGSSKKKSVRLRRRHSLAGILSTLKGASSSSSRNNQQSNKYPSVRSSMVLHISDEDAAITDVPEILYDDYISTESMLSTQSSSCQFCNMNNNNNSSNNNSSACPHRQQYVHHHHHHHYRSNNHNNSQAPSSSSSGSRPQRGRLYSEGSWFYSWVQHHPRRKKNKQRLIRKNSSSGNDTNNTDIKKSSAFIRPPTISSLSSLSNPLSKLDSIIHQNYPHRFSAFWFDTHGRSGKQHVEIDERNAIANIKHDGPHWKFSPSTVQSSMFLFGFLLFPLWWVGAWIYLRHPTRFSSKNDLETQSLSFANPRILGMLNCWMSCFSILIVPIIIGLGVWYHYSVRNV